MEWQPIETAPKDGTEVWAFIQTQLTAQEQAVMKWIEDDGGLWIYADDALSDIDPYPTQPSHWMPLPPPPKGTE